MNIILKLKNKKLSLSRTMASEGPKIRLITQEGDNLEVSIAFILVNNSINNSVYIGWYVNRQTVPTYIQYALRYVHLSDLYIYLSDEN